MSLSVKKTRKREFLEQMDKVVPWQALIDLIAPYYPEGNKGRPPFSLATMLRTHFLQQWFTLSDPGMEEAFFDVPLYREFAQLPEFSCMPDESTILRFRHRLEKHKLTDQILATVNDLLIERGLLLKTGTVVDATLIAAPSSTKNIDKARDPEMHSSQKGNQWHFGMKAHIGTDADSGLVHTVRGTSGNVHDATSKFGADCAASYQSGTDYSPSPPCASAPSHIGGPRAGKMRGDSATAPMCSTMMRIWPPQNDHNSENTSFMRSIGAAYRMCAGV